MYLIYAHQKTNPEKVINIRIGFKNQDNATKAAATANKLAASDTHWHVLTEQEYNQRVEAGTLKP
jgi:hypothetical protein